MNNPNTSTETEAVIKKKKNKSPKAKTSDQIASQENCFKYLEKS